MPNLQIDTGAIRLTINGDESRVLEFSPADLSFAERFYSLTNDFNTRLTDFQYRDTVFNQDQRVDSDGLPVNVPERLAMLREACEYIREKIDTVFGAGTSQLVFGDALQLEMFEQFFTQITPYFQQVRTEKMAAYRPPPMNKAKRKRK